MLVGGGVSPFARLVDQRGISNETRKQPVRKRQTDLLIAGLIIPIAYDFDCVGGGRDRHSPPHLRGVLFFSILTAVQ